jgi:hypothetical protein
MRSSRRTSNAFLHDDHDLYTLVSRNSTPASSLPASPVTSPPHLYTPTVSPSHAQFIPNFYTPSSSMVDMAQTLGLPNIPEEPSAPSLIITPPATPSHTPSSTPSHTPSITPSQTPTITPSTPPQIRPSSSAFSNLLPYVPTPSASAREKRKATIKAFCANIASAVDYEIALSDSSLLVLERAIRKIGACFDTVSRLRDTQVSKCMAPLVDVMEIVARNYVDRAGSKCIQGIYFFVLILGFITNFDFLDCNEVLHAQSNREEITGTLTSYIDATLASINSVITMAHAHIDSALSSFPIHQLLPRSSLPFSWFFDCFLRFGCDTIHAKTAACDGRSAKEKVEKGLYEGEGWCTFKRWDECDEHVKGWVELIGYCEALFSTFDQLYTKFEKVYRPLTDEMLEKVSPNLPPPFRSELID